LLNGLPLAEPTLYRIGLALEAAVKFRSKYTPKILKPV
jgi:hypothetical protein